MKTAYERTLRNCLFQKFRFSISYESRNEIKNRPVWYGLYHKVFLYEILVCSSDFVFLGCFRISFKWYISSFSSFCTIYVTGLRYILLDNILCREQNNGTLLLWLLLRYSYDCALFLRRSEAFCQLDYKKISTHYLCNIFPN